MQKHGNAQTAIDEAMHQSIYGARFARSAENLIWMKHDASYLEALGLRKCTQTQSKEDDQETIVLLCNGNFLWKTADIERCLSCAKPIYESHEMGHPICARSLWPLNAMINERVSLLK